MDLKAEGLLNEAADYFAATLPDVDPRAWRQLLTYCPDELLTAALRREGWPWQKVESDESLADHHAGSAP